VIHHYPIDYTAVAFAGDYRWRHNQAEATAAQLALDD